MYLLLFLVVVIVVALGVENVRRPLLTKPIFMRFRRVLPPLSDVEREALAAGSQWWDVQLFRGRPDWQQLLAFPKPALTSDEQAFLDHEVNTLLMMADDDQFNRQADLSAEVWQYLRNNGFFALILPKEYGGKDFSPVACSTIVARIATRSLSTAVTVMVPNSLGPGELLLKYGTDQQKQRWLPGLADGSELPCFALTSPEAGSDAGAIPDRGDVCYGEFDGQQVLGIRLNFDKRYITLAPVATVVGLAFKLYDPEQLLGEKASLGITCALLPADHPGLSVGERHKPMDLAFMNGTVKGQDVFIPLDWIIGGAAFAGKGWQMLVECLSAGRGISLPALATGNGHLCARMTGAYAYLRKQFGQPIGQFEGIQEAMARIGGLNYVLESSRLMTAQALASGESPTVITAIAKYHMTELSRQIVNDAMDIHAGKAIQMGPGNYLALAYKGLPVSITVEGANILTRSLMIFGLTAVRCHPFIAQEMEAVSADNEEEGLEQFDRVFRQHLFYGIGNAASTLWQGITGGRFNATPVAGETAPYYRQLTRMSRALALVADMTMLLLGGKLKQRELLSARLGDVLSHLYLASAVLKHYEQMGRQQADLPYVHFALQWALHQIGQAFSGILANFPAPWLGTLLRLMIFPFGINYKQPKDHWVKQVARAMMQPGVARERLTHLCHIDINKEGEGAQARVERAFIALYEARHLEKKLQVAQSIGELPKGLDIAELLLAAGKAGLLSEDEIEQLRAAESARRAAIAVDVFAETEAKG